jgi:hypothetical protein
MGIPFDTESAGATTKAQMASPASPDINRRKKKEAGSAARGLMRRRCARLTTRAAPFRPGIAMLALLCALNLPSPCRAERGRSGAPSGATPTRLQAASSAALAGAMGSPPKEDSNTQLFSCVK